MKGLTGNQLKIIALLSMTVDHVGQQLFPGVMLFRMIGRLAFPIFAYMIAEGCVYTKSRKRYLGTIAGLALVCQLVYFFALGSVYQCILVTFSLSIGLIYLLDSFDKKRGARELFLVLFALMGLFFLTELLPLKLSGTDFRIDYGFWGVLTPVLIYFAKTKRRKLGMLALGLCFISASIGPIQWYCLISVLLLALYTGKRGTWNLKYLFYIYYPLHLVVIHLLAKLL